MPLLVIVIIAAVIYLLAYLTYGRFLSKFFKLDSTTVTPAVELRDDVDFVPIEPKFLFGQHFSAIAAAGPIVGPILGGVMFGWLPAFLWLIIGAIFIGGVHDMGSLIASVRHKARSIADVVLENMNRRSYSIFLIFIWIALIYVIVAFTDIVAGSFVGKQTLEDGTIISGGGIATSSILYLILPVIMGLLLKFTKLSLKWATIIFLPLVGLAIWIGPQMPFELGQFFGLTEIQTIKLWDVLLLTYCLVASVIPMWILLQPRGHLGGYFLLVALIGGMLGIIFGGKTIQYPAFLSFSTLKGESLFPLLFITIACGACSGFHALVASGTSSKQIKSETDVKSVGYGAMLMEGMVAVVSLCCVMMLVPGTGLLSDGQPKANLIYGLGLGSFLQVVGIPLSYAVSFALLAFATFVYDTLDVSTRLARYILQELLHLKGNLGRWTATLITVLAPLFFVMQQMKDTSGNPIPAWRVFWPLFGACNQLLAALALTSVTVWWFKKNKSRWALPVIGIPALWMFVMSCWALLGFMKIGFWPMGIFVWTTDIIAWVALILIILAAVILIEALRVLFSGWVSSKKYPRYPRVKGPPIF